MASVQRTWANHLLLALVLCLAAAARLDGAALPLWLDEAYSYWSATQPWTSLWNVIPRYEAHPVLWYSLVKLWLAFGDNELTLRLLPLSLSLLAIPCIYLAGLTLGGRRFGLLAALLLACAPFQILQAQNLRPYALATLASAILICAALHLVRDVDAAARPLWRLSRMPRATRLAYLGLTLGWALLLWSHNLNLLLCASVALYLGLWWWTTGRSAILLANLTIAGLLAILLYAPNIAILIQQYGAVRHGWWLTMPSPATLLFQTIELIGFPFYHADYKANLLVNFLLGAPFLLGAAIAFRKGEPALRRMMTLLLFAALGPWIAAITISVMVVPIFVTRSLIMIQVPAILLAAAAAVAWTGPRYRLGLPMLAFPPLAAAMLFHLYDRRTEDPEYAWKSIVADAAASEARHPIIVAVPNSSALPLDYYAARSRRRISILPVPAPYPATGFARYPTGNAGVPAIDSDQLAGVAAQLRGSDEVWYVARNVQFYDPTHHIERLLTRRFPCMDRSGMKSAAILTLIRFYKPRPETRVDCHGR